MDLQEGVSAVSGELQAVLTAPVLVLRLGGIEVGFEAVEDGEEGHGEGDAT